MRQIVYILNILLFSVLVNSASKAQGVTNLPCTVYDPLVEFGLPSLFGDLCCGGSIEGYNVCYTIEGWQTCGQVQLLEFEFAGVTYPVGHLMENAGALAATLNNTLINAGFPWLAQFEGDNSTFSVCADMISSNEFQLLTIVCGSETIQIAPSIEEINSCPVNMDVLEAAYDGIIDPKPYVNMELFHIDNTVSNAGGIDLENTVSGGPTTTDDLLNGTWDIEPGSTINPNALPSNNEMGHLLNAVFGSGLMSSPCMDVNINCMVNELVQFPFGQLDVSELNTLNSELAAAGIEMADVTGGLESWLGTLEGAGATPAAYINSIFGWNLPDTPCDSGNFGSSDRESNQEARSSAPPESESNPDEDYASQDIPGIGAGAVSPPTPSAMAMAKDISGGVSLYNGAQTANIPLHTLQAYDISVPVSVSTSNNGLQVDALPGSAGQHWSINAGGQITRTVKGLPDEFNGTIEGVGVGQQEMYLPRIEIPSLVGLAIQSAACPDVVVPQVQQVRTGIKWQTVSEIGSIDNLGPIKMDISWSGFQPDKLQLTLYVPIFQGFGYTIYLQVGMHAGFAKNTRLMPIEYRERALGYSHIDEGGAMDELGLDALNEQLIENLSPEKQFEVLNAMHPTRKREEDAVVSDLAGTWGAVRATFDALLDGTIVHNTNRVDLQADEFHFTAGAWSGKFFIKPDGEVLLTPYQPGVHITPHFENGAFTRFEVQTPDGFIYTFGAYGSGSYIDYTQDMTYLLPNFYAYPEKNINRELFGKARIDVSILERYPFFIGGVVPIPYGNTYDRNYKITQGPRYASAWHLVNIRSIKTQEEVNFEYALREGLSYFSNKSYTHTFPDFEVTGSGEEAEAKTKYYLQHNPIHLATTRWENGRAEFTYTATQTTQDRWDLTGIIGNRGEKIVFLYGGDGGDKGEVSGDVVCTKILVNRQEQFYRGWGLKYGYPNAFGQPLAIRCPMEDVNNTSGLLLPIAVSEETTFSLGYVYDPDYADYNRYFFLNFAICKFNAPVRLRFPIPVSFDTSDISRRNAISELGSLMEVRALAYNNFDGAGTIDWLDFDAHQMLEILQAEGKRTFLVAVEEIDRQGANHAVVSVGYNDIDLLPKRFSTDQDEYGYANKNESGSPFPAISYSSSLNDTDESSSDPGMAVHYGFYNITNGYSSIPDTWRGKSPPSPEYALRGSIAGLTLESGAKILYEYELNVLDGSGAPGAGLRVKQKVEDPGDTPAKTTKYVYESPSVNTLPSYVSKNGKDFYLRVSIFNLERRVVVSSYPQNMMLPNGSNLTGYGKVREVWPPMPSPASADEPNEGLGEVVHHFTTPDNFTDHIAIPTEIYDDFNSTNVCLDYTRPNSTLFVVLEEQCGEVSVQSSPSVFMPGILRQSDFLFGVEWYTETKNAAGDEVLVNESTYRLVPQPKRPDGSEKIRLFNSAMYQYNHYGSFLHVFTRRLITQYAPYALGEDGVPSFAHELVDLVFNNIGFSERYVQRRFETVHYDYPAFQIVLDQSKTTETYSGGGSTTSRTFVEYLPEEGRELLASKTRVEHSDNNIVETRYHYAFQAGAQGASPLLALHDNAVLTYLNQEDYRQPVAEETYVNGVRTQAGLTALTMHANKIAPKANYGLQNGNLALIGKFESYTDDAKPEKYILAKFGATLGSPASDFFEPIDLMWYAHLNLPLKSREYFEFKTVHSYNDLFEYAGNTDVNGVSTEYTYNERGWLAGASLLNGHQVSTYSYGIGLGANHVLMKTQYGTGEQMNTRQDIDGFGKEKKLLRLNDGATLNSKCYDSFWRVISERNIGTGIVTMKYEASPLSKLLRTTDEENNTFIYAYRGGGPAFVTNAVTDPNGHTNESAYNSLEQLVSALNIPEESRTVYTYDALLRPSTITNPIGEVFAYEYNDMGLLWRSTVPGRGPQSVWYDHKFRPIATLDGNGQYILTGYDNFDRPEKTYLYESGFSLSGAGIYNADLSNYYVADKLLTAVAYASNSKTWVNHTENRLLDGASSGAPVMVVSDNLLDDIGRVIQSATQYPDAEVITSLTHSSAGYLLSSYRDITHNSGSSVSIGDQYLHDNVLRPQVHKVIYGGGWVLANRMEYNNEDHLLTKWVGGMPMVNNRFLQEVNYAYDKTGRLVRINNAGTYFCNIGEEVCSFSLKLTFPPLDWQSCNMLSGIRINGQFYPLSTPLNTTSQLTIAKDIEAALDAYGLGGEVIVVFNENAEGQALSIKINNSSATELSLVLGPCGQEVAFSADCCTIPPAEPTPPTPPTEENPGTCTADLYHQLMQYKGLDISRITIGSGCNFKMRNQYVYDGLHRIREMNNVLFGSSPNLDVFSCTYHYDKAGNIKWLTRRGIVGPGPDNAPQSDVIDHLSYTYTGNNGLSSVLSGVQDLAGNPQAQPLGVGPLMNSYAHDGNGNLTTAGPVQAQYNVMNLPTQLTTSAGVRSFAYIYGQGKYRSGIATASPNPIEETRHYLGGMEFKNGIPETYNFSDGRIVYEEGQAPRPQFRLADHLGNTVVFFEDKNQDGCVTTEADTDDPEELEILQRLWYYPFGMTMSGLSQWDTEPGQWYRYNGKERDTLSGWTDFGARWGILEIGRWNGVDPLADWAPDWTPYRYGFDNPISYTDPFGLFESHTEARRYRRDCTDLTRKNSRIQKNNEGRWEIRDKNSHMTITKTDEGFVEYSATASAYGFRSREAGFWEKMKGGDLLSGAIYGAANGVFVLGQSPFYGRGGNIPTLDGFSVVKGSEAGIQTGVEGLLTIAPLFAPAFSATATGEITVYRVFGGDARAQGFSWTTKNPTSIKDFRNVAGLPSGGASGATNTADFMIKGKVNINNIIKTRSALPLDGNKGGLPELIIDPKNVRLTDFKVFKQ